MVNIASVIIELLRLKMTTKEAFKKLLSNPAKLSKLNLKPSTLRTLNKRVKDGKLLSIKKMEAMLVSAGYKKTPEKWV